MASTTPHSVKILEECLISPPPASVPPTTLPLTFFDLGWFIAPPINFMFYAYPHPTSHFLDNVLPHLKHSLSLTLQHYYSLAGNVTWPQGSAKPQIAYKEGDSVAFALAESDYDFDELSGNHFRDTKPFSALVPKFKDVSSSSGGEKLLPILAVQVTLFPNKGLCMGISIHHVAGDGRSCTAFIKSWASVCKSQGNVSFPLPLYDRSTVADFKADKHLSVLKDLEKVGLTRDTFHVMPKQDEPPADSVRATFVMGSSDIKKLKHWVLERLQKAQNDETPPPAPFFISSVVVTCAYAWVCLIKSRWGDKGDSEAIEHLLIPADVRARLTPPVPETYFGNCFNNVTLTAKRGDLMGEEGVAVAAKAIRSAIQDMDINVAKDLAFYMTLPKGQVLMLASSPKFGIYEADFGWGRPKKSEISTVDSGLPIALSECPDDAGGIEIGLVRSRVEMEAFASIFAHTLPALVGTQYNGRIGPQ